MSEPLVISVATPDQALAAASGLVWFAVGENSADGRSEPVPARGRMLLLRVQLSDCASSPTTVTAQLARGSDGSGQLSNRALTAASQTISFDKTASTTSTSKGVVLWPLSEVPYHRRPDDTAGTLYVGLQLDAGSAVVEELELYIERSGSER